MNGSMGRFGRHGCWRKAVSGIEHGRMKCIERTHRTSHPRKFLLTESRIEPLPGLVGGTWLRETVAINDSPHGSLSILDCPILSQ
jgi:hypothetical protein